MVFSDRFEEVSQEEITKALPQQSEHPNLTEKLDLDNFHDIIEGCNIGYPEDMRRMILQGQILNGETLLRATENLHINIADLETMLDDMEGETFSAEVIFRYMNKEAYPGLNKIIQEFLCHKNSDFRTITRVVSANIGDPEKDIDKELGSASRFSPDTVAEYSKALKTDSTQLFNSDYSLTDLSSSIYSQEPASETDTHLQNLRSQGTKDIMNNLFRDINMLITYLKQFSGKSETELENKPQKATLDNPDQLPLINSEPQILHNDYIEEVTIISPKAANAQELKELIEEHNETDDENLIFAALFQESCAMFNINHQKYFKMQDGTPTLDLANANLKKAQITFLLEMYKLYAINMYTDSQGEALWNDIAGDNITETIHNIHTYKIATKQENWKDRDYQDYESIRLTAMQKSIRSKEEIQKSATEKINQYNKLYPTDTLTIPTPFETQELIKLKRELYTKKGNLGRTTPINKDQKQNLSYIIQDISEILYYDHYQVLQVASMIFSTHTEQNMAERNDWETLPIPIVSNVLSLLTNDNEMSLTALDLQGGLQSKIEQSNLLQAGANEGQFHQRLLDESKDQSGKIKIELFKTTLTKYADQALVAIVNLPGLTNKDITQENIDNLKKKIQDNKFKEFTVSDLRILKQGAFADTMHEQLAYYLQEYRTNKQVSANQDQAISEISSKLNASETSIRQTTVDMAHLSNMDPVLMSKNILKAVQKNPNFSELSKNAAISAPIFYNDGKFTIGANAGLEGVGLHFTLNNITLADLEKSKITFSSISGFGFTYTDIANPGAMMTGLLGTIESNFTWETKGVRTFFRSISIGGGLMAGIVPYVRLRANIFDTHEKSQYTKFQTTTQNSNLTKPSATKEQIEDAYLLMKHIVKQGGTAEADIKKIENENFPLAIKDKVETIIAQFNKYIEDNMTEQEKIIIKSKVYTQIANKLLDIAEANITGFGLYGDLYKFPGLTLPGISANLSYNQNLIQQKHTTQDALDIIARKPKLKSTERSGLIEFLGTESRGLIKGETKLDKNVNFLKLINRNGLKYETNEDKTKHYLTIDPHQYQNTKVELYLGTGVALNVRAKKPDRIQFDPSQPIKIDRIHLTSGASKGTTILSISTKEESAATLRKNAKGLITLKSRKKENGQFIRQAQFQSFIPSKVTKAQDGTTIETPQHKIPTSLNTPDLDTIKTLNARQLDLKEDAKNTKIQEMSRKLVQKFSRNPRTLEVILKTLAKSRITENNQQISTQDLTNAILDFAKYVNNFWKGQKNAAENSFNIDKLKAILKPGNPNFEYIIAHLNPASIEQLAGNMKSNTEVHEHASKCADSLKPIIKNLTGVQNVNLMKGIKQDMMPAKPTNVRTNAKTLKGYTILATRLPLSEDDEQRNQTRGVQPFDIRSNKGNEVELLKFTNEKTGVEVTDNRLEAAHKLWDKSANIGTNSFSRTESKLISLQSKVHGVHRSPLADLLGETSIPTEGENKGKWENLMQEIQTSADGTQIQIRDSQNNLRGTLKVAKSAQVVMLANCANPSLAFKLDLTYEPVTVVAGNFRRGSNQIFGGRIKRGIGGSLFLPIPGKDDISIPKPTKQQSSSNRNAQKVQSSQKTPGEITI